MKTMSCSPAYLLVTMTASRTCCIISLMVSRVLLQSLGGPWLRGRQQPPSVSVAPPYMKRTEYSAFQISQEDGFETSYDAVAALQVGLPSLDAQNLIEKDGSSVLVPTNEESFLMLSS